MKLSYSRYVKTIGDLALAMQGPWGLLDHPDARALGVFQQKFLNAVQSSIGGGTDEIQRNIIGERVLGLPARASVASAVDGADGRVAHEGSGGAAPARRRRGDGARFGRRLRRRADARRGHHRRRRPRHDLPLLLLEGPPARRGARSSGCATSAGGCRPDRPRGGTRRRACARRPPAGDTRHGARPAAVRSGPDGAGLDRPARGAVPARGRPRDGRHDGPRLPAPTSTRRPATTSSARSATSGSRR